jgi:drug/metabolite transporter (DMT)-like permease
MGALLAVISALAYGASDFLAGLASRRSSAVPVSAVVLGVEFISAWVATIFFHGVGPTPETLLWGAVGGVGSAVGTLALYHGFAVGRISVVATICGVLTVILPAIVGVALGNHLSVLSAVGIVAAIPAVALVCWHGGPKRAGQSGVLYGVIAGGCFALLFIALSQAGTGSGAWPLVSGQIVCCLLVAPLAIRELRRNGPPAGSAFGQSVIAGVTGGIAALLYLTATGLGELAIIAVLTSMYPAVTVLLARVVLSERWTRMQALGLILSAAAVVVVATG